MYNVLNWETGTVRGLLTLSPVVETMPFRIAKQPTTAADASPSDYNIVVVHTL